jgi:hypothetical protein
MGEKMLFGHYWPIGGIHCMISMTHFALLLRDAIYEDPGIK